MLLLRVFSDRGLFGCGEGKNESCDLPVYLRTSRKITRCWNQRDIVRSFQTDVSKSILSQVANRTSIDRAKVCAWDSKAGGRWCSEWSRCASSARRTRLVV